MPGIDLIKHSKTDAHKGGTEACLRNEDNKPLSIYSTGLARRWVRDNLFPMPTPDAYLSCTIPNRAKQNQTKY
jgi:hypothetical protein